MSDGVADGVRRAWGWVAALSDGATTPWAAWSGEAESGGRHLPGAQQLELLRRLNERTRPTSDLVARVLTASSAGRGAPDLELDGAAPPSAFGPRPVDPARLGDDDLLRVATALLADELARSASVRADSITRSITRSRTRSPAAVARPRYQLSGVPWWAEPVRADLTRRGRPPGGRSLRRGTTAYVLGTDVASMLALAFTARAFDEGGTSWPTWLAGAASRRRLPPRADLPAMAAHWAGRLGAQQVRIVLGPDAVARTARTLGASHPRPAPPPSADAVDLARQVGAPLGLLVLPGRRAELLREVLLPRLIRLNAVDAVDGGAPLAVPAEHADWVRERAVRMRRAILRAGYPVDGDLDLLSPTCPTTGSGQPANGRVLDLALDLLAHDRRREHR